MSDEQPKQPVTISRDDPHRGRADHPLKTAKKAALSATVATCSVNEADKTIGLRIEGSVFRYCPNSDMACTRFRRHQSLV
jgi:hypothetical protein